MTALEDKIKQVNDRIDAYERKRIKQEGILKAQQDQFDELAADYEKKFGVKFDRTDKNVASQIKKELVKVSKELQGKLEESEDILNKLDSGDIRGAYEVLGVPLDTATDTDTDTAMDTDADTDTVEESSDEDSSSDEVEVEVDVEETPKPISTDGDVDLSDIAELLEDTEFEV